MDSHLSDARQLTEKARGKQKATDSDDTRWLPQEHKLSDSFRSGCALAKGILGPSITRTNPDERVPKSLAGPGKAEEERLRGRMSDLEFNLDQLFAYVSTARSIANVAEMDLNQRFGIVSAALEARSNVQLGKEKTSTGDGLSGAQVLDTYAPRPGVGAADPQELLRALARVDRERPPAKIGDAARRAVREVQRAQESGQAPYSERRLTFAPPPGTPRTPRRGGTPKKDRPPSQPR